MNKRIKELAEQAGIELFGNTGVETTQASLAKFAELIVRACADAGDDAYDCRCVYIGDCIVEQLGYGTEEGASTFRSKK